MAGWCRNWSPEVAWKRNGKRSVGKVVAELILPWGTGTGLGMAPQGCCCLIFLGFAVASGHRALLEQGLWQLLKF